MLNIIGKLLIMYAPIVVILVVIECIVLAVELLFNVRSAKKYKKYNKSFADIFCTAINPYKEKKIKKQISFYPFVIITSWTVVAYVTAIFVFCINPHINPILAIALIIFSFPVVLVCSLGLPSLFFEIYITITSYRKKSALRKIEKIRKKYLTED